MAGNDPVPRDQRRHRRKTEGGNEKEAETKWLKDRKIVKEGIYPLRPVFPTQLEELWSEEGKPIKSTAELNPSTTYFSPLRYFDFRTMTHIRRFRHDITISYKRENVYLPPHEAVVPGPTASFLHQVRYLREIARFGEELRRTIRDLVWTQYVRLEVLGATMAGDIRYWMKRMTTAIEQVRAHLHVVEIDGYVHGKAAKEHHAFMLAMDYAEIEPLHYETRQLLRMYLRRWVCTTFEWSSNPGRQWGETHRVPVLPEEEDVAIEPETFLEPPVRYAGAPQGPWGGRPAPDSDSDDNTNDTPHSTAPPKSTLGPREEASGQATSHPEEEQDDLGPLTCSRPDSPPCAPFVTQHEGVGEEPPHYSIPVQGDEPGLEILCDKQGQLLEHQETESESEKDGGR